jgi:hypothetical protein
MNSVWISPELSLGVQNRGMTPIAPLPAAVAPEIAYIIRRSGQRPLRFEGMLMVEHVSPAEGMERRHTIRLYETTQGAVVIEIALEAADGSVLPHIVTEMVDSMGEAESFIRSYDPAAQAPLMLDLSSLDGQSISAQAAALETGARRLRTDFEQVRAAVLSATDTDGASQDNLAKRTN